MFSYICYNDQQCHWQWQCNDQEDKAILTNTSNFKIIKPKTFTFLIDKAAPNSLPPVRLKPQGGPPLRVTSKINLFLSELGGENLCILLTYIELWNFNSIV